MKRHTWLRTILEVLHSGLGKFLIKYSELNTKQSRLHLLQDRYCLHKTDKMMTSFLVDSLNSGNSFHSSTVYVEAMAFSKGLNKSTQGENIKQPLCTNHKTIWIQTKSTVWKLQSWINYQTILSGHACQKFTFRNSTLFLIETYHIWRKRIWFWWFVIRLINAKHACITMVLARIPCKVRQD